MSYCKRARQDKERICCRWKLESKLGIKHTVSVQDCKFDFSHSLGILFAQDRSILGNSMQCIPGPFQKACHLDIRKS